MKPAHIFQTIEKSLIAAVHKHHARRQRAKEFRRLARQNRRSVFVVPARAAAWVIRIAAAVGLPIALAAWFLTLTGCSYSGQKAGEIDARPLFPKIILDTSINVGKK